MIAVVSRCSKLASTSCAALRTTRRLLPSASPRAGPAPACPTVVTLSQSCMNARCPNTWVVTWAPRVETRPHRTQIGYRPGGHPQTANTVRRDDHVDADTDPDASRNEPREP